MKDTNNLNDDFEDIKNDIFSELKNFQIDTINEIENKYEVGIRRVLVSDEVGLGKTLVAKGVIVKRAIFLREKGYPHISIIYVCSNSSICGQNLKKLRISNNVLIDNTQSSRLSMQHLQIFNREINIKENNNYISLIPLTPSTSFKITGSGLKEERALIYVLLKEWRKKNTSQISEQELESLKNKMMIAARSNWDSAIKEETEAVRTCNKKTNGEYLSYMINMISNHINTIPPKTLINDGDKTYLQYIKELCNNTREDIIKITSILRYLFADISLERLRPDLVILDEFQRFNDLLVQNKKSETTEEEKEASDLHLLCEKFFNASETNVLLLSATPYKMYASLDEIEENQLDEHFEEFYELMYFLRDSSESQIEFKNIWDNYSKLLKEGHYSNKDFLIAKEKAQEALFNNICRTERISTKNVTDLIESTNYKKPFKITREDVISYIEAQNTLNILHIESIVPVDYSKSCPFLLSFMKDYKMKQSIEQKATQTVNHDEIDNLSNSHLWLSHEDINEYKKINSYNSRFENLKTSVFKNDSHLLLWIPPSIPYYDFGGVFAKQKHFSKTLIFSAWEMVPRMASSLLSYEEDRLTVHVVAEKNKTNKKSYFLNDIAEEDDDEKKQKKRYPPPRLNLKTKKEKENNRIQAVSLTLFTHLYPSETLCNLYSPSTWLNKNVSDLEVIKTSIKTTLRTKMEKLRLPQKKGNDRKWYYLIPMLLDSKSYVDKWFCAVERLIQEASNKERKPLEIYFNELQYWYNCAYEKKYQLFGGIPADIDEMLSIMTLASPATCIRRSYLVYKTDFDLSFPTEFAKGFLNRMDKPEALSIVELSTTNKKIKDDDHWRNLLNYCLDGNFQALLDEYCHVLSNNENLKDKFFINNLHTSLIDSLRIHTARYSFDTHEDFKNRCLSKKSNKKVSKIRTHYAVSFTQGDGNETDTNRKESVRKAFNSPFWPFILISTSVGQEGLDFHNYCRKIVHWNLPGNPIDLEQREGRINRYECLAIRQNIAQRYSSFAKYSNDIWKSIFDIAAQFENPEKKSQIIPHWGLTHKDNMIKIERSVLMYPYSLDEENYNRLTRILALYRLTLGQPRQEELINFLSENCKDLEECKNMAMNLSPYERNHN
ncbi:DEAD/DEAH box helicase [Treponema bryantii]|uniref:DEAD/DEAH box helicase n=1 Tax=Treponema bryantii TaxID=163 RepID=UPI0003B58E07|nr:helicase-related protein [Treponema bryantii]